MVNDFKAFILRGNVIDLAIGVAIGAAFATVIPIAAPRCAFCTADVAGV